MKEYNEIVLEVLDRGTRKENRTGVDTISCFNINKTYDLRRGFPLLTGKRMSWWNIVAENLWFLSGDPKIDFLRKHGIKFWDPWVDESGRVPSAYGNFWRKFPVHGESWGNNPRCDAQMVDASFNDQIEWVLNEIKTKPMSRRMVVNAWAPGQAQASSLPPCHYTFCLNVQNLPVAPDTIEEEADREIFRHMNVVAGLAKLDFAKTEPHLCLHVTQRSCDVALGVPYNIAGYSFLLSLFAHLTNLKPGLVGHSLVDAHIYTKKPDGSMAEYDHIPGLQEQIARPVRPLPKLTIDPSIGTLADVEALLSSSKEEILDKFRIEQYDPHEPINFKVAV